MTAVGLCLEPLDVLFFRDGRPFDAASRVTSGLPTPQVLAGAVRTALLEKFGCSFADLKKQNATTSFAACLPPDHRWIAEVRFGGPWLCRLPGERPKTELDVYLPVPATVHTGKKGKGDAVRRLTPLSAGALPGWRGDLRPRWLAGGEATEAATNRFLGRVGQDRFLNNLDLTRADLHKGEGRPEDDDAHMCEFDHRTGIGIDGGGLVAGEGEIYGISFLSVKPGYGFYAEAELPGGAADLAGVPFLAFGGESKRVRLRAVDPFDFPKVTPTGTQKPFVLLTTPCVTDASGVPYHLRERVVAAAVNTPVAFSGWDIAKNGPKPTRFAAPAGSVYFLNSADPPPELADELGFGCHLTGVWTDE